MTSVTMVENVLETFLRSCKIWDLGNSIDGMAFISRT